MRQLITRIDDELHEKLKRKAASEGRSMNLVVTEAIEHAVATEETPREAFRRRAAARGIRFVEIDAPTGPIPTWDELDAENRGARISDIIEAERARLR